MGRRPILLRVLVILAVAFAGWLIWETARWPDVARLRASNPPTTAFIEQFRAGQRAAGEPDQISWTWVPYDRISPHLKKAILVSEDINFFSHRGFDTAEMGQALRKAVVEFETPRGASTISQQLTRNLWLSPSRNPIRKLREAVLTSQLERTLAKDRILAIYLNVAELGPGVYGVEAASRRYFGRAARSLSKRQAARLAATLPAPTQLNPEQIEAEHWRVRLILERMDKVKFLDRYL